MPRPDKDLLIQEMLSEISLQTSDKPKPDSAEWWQEVAQGLGVTIHQMRQRLAAAEAQVAALTAELKRERAGYTDR